MCGGTWFCTPVPNRLAACCVPDNPMGVVGWDGPPDDVSSVSGDAGPMAPGSIVNAPFEGYGFGLD